MKLGDFMHVRTGLPLSRKQADAETAHRIYTALTLRAISDDGQINSDFTEPYFASELLKREYFTHVGDVLIRLSAPYTVIVVIEGKQDLLVSQHFSIIRRKECDINPHFLKWWLAQNRKRFYKLASGAAYMGTISSGYISEMDFAPPPFDLQCKIGRLLELAGREKELLAQLSVKKSKLINSTLRKIMEET